MEDQHQLLSCPINKKPFDQSSQIKPTCRIISTGNCTYTVLNQNHTCFCHQGLFVYNTGTLGLQDNCKTCGHPLLDHADAQSLSKGKSIVIV